VGRVETKSTCVLASAMFFAETRRNAVKYLTRSDTSSGPCGCLRVSLIHLTLNELVIKQYGIGRKYNMLSLLIEIRTTPLILDNSRINVDTLLTCTFYSVQAVNAISVVSLFIYGTRKHIALIVCVSFMCRTAGRIMMNFL
jgi:hypothetical protein